MRSIEKYITIFLLFLSGIFREISSYYLSQKLSISDNVLYFGFILLLSLLFLFYLHQRKKIFVDINVDVLRESSQQEENAHKGLVLFLSPFQPQRGSDLEILKNTDPDGYNKALQDKDIDKLMLDDTTQSNFGHSIVAIKAHKSRLEHVWLICSASKSGKTAQSIDFAPLMEEYIKQKINQNVEVHYGDNYKILLDEDSSVCRQSFKIVKKIYKEARSKYRLKNKDMITDVTGGTKSINIPAILACLNKDEDIQIIGTSYDDYGKFKGDPFPMIIEYKPSFFDLD